MATQREIELCQEILALAIQVNSQGKFNVWAEFHGHVDNFEVRVSPLWREGIADLEGWSSFDDKNSFQLSTNFKPMRSISKNDRALFLVEKLGNLKHELAKFLVEEAAQ